MAAEIGLFEAMYTQRALRYISPDPIPDALVRQVLDAGIRAPNGGNQQRWRFIVIKDPDTKRWIQERYRSTERPAHAPPQNPADCPNPTIGLRFVHNRQPTFSTSFQPAAWSMSMCIKGSSKSNYTATAGGTCRCLYPRIA